MKKTGFIFTLSITILVSCASQKLRFMLEEPVSGTPLKLPVYITRISIEDKRTVADDRDIKTSALAVPGRADEIAPALTSVHKELFEKEFGKYFSSTAADYNAGCTIQIIEGVKRYKSSWSGEDMFVRSKIRVVLSDSLHTPSLAAAAGETEFTFQSTIANKSNFEKLYQKAMKTALFKALESINSGLQSVIHAK